jgi:hypothetical protein
MKEVVLRIIAILILISVFLKSTYTVYQSLLILFGIMMLFVSDNNLIEKKQSGRFVTLLSNQIVSFSTLFYLFNKVDLWDGDFSVIFSFTVLAVIFIMISHIYKYTLGHLSSFRFWIFFSYICGVLSYVL